VLTRATGSQAERNNRLLPKPKKVIKRIVSGENFLDTLKNSKINL